MSERPDGDAIDQELRRAMTDIASVPGPAPELDEFSGFLTPNEGERTMNRGTRVGLLVAAVAVLIVGLLLFINNDDDDDLDTIESPAPTTSTEGTSTTTETEVTSTRQPSTTSNSATNELTNQVIEAIATSASWAEYVDQADLTLGAGAAARCALTPLDLFTSRAVGAGVDQYELAGKPDAYSFEADVGDAKSYLTLLLPWLRLHESAVGELNELVVVGAGSRDLRQTWAEELQAIRSAADGVAAQAAVDGISAVELGPLLEAVAFMKADPNLMEFGQTGELNDASCPVVWWAPPIGPAFQSFSSDVERFGGRGEDAALRCAAFAAFRLLLGHTVDRGTEESVAARADDALVLVEAFWTDRPIDQPVVDLAERWRAIDFVDGFATWEQLLEVQGVLDDLRAYRASMPEGGILCPLDEG